MATGVFALEARRWVESGARVKISVNAPMKMWGDAVIDPDQEFIFASVINIGELPTSIETVALMTFRSIFHRIFLFKNNWAAVALLPIGSPPLPFLLPQGAIWRGGIIYDEELPELFLARKLFVAIYVTHKNRPTLKRVKIRKAISDGSAVAGA